MPPFPKKRNHVRDHEPPPIMPGSPVTDRSSSVSFSSSRRISRSSKARVEARREFLKVTSKGFRGEVYTDPESLPSLETAYNSFQSTYPRFAETWAIDDLRDREYSHLVEEGHVCMDYCGFGLFCYYQQVMNKASASFGLAYVSANLSTHALCRAAEEGIAEAYIRRRVMDYLNVSEQEYSMVFTVSRGYAFRVLAESYPFHLSRKLLTVYDFESEAVNWMADCAKRKGAKIMRASFKWPSLRLNSSELKKQLQVKKRKSGSKAKGLFVFPVQSRMTGAKYSYQWMSQAQQNKWHVLLDVSALGPKDMDSLGLSLFRPDFIVSSFYKVFGIEPSGFGCLFIKNSAIRSLHNSSRAVGLVRIISGCYSPTTGDQSRNSEEDFQPSAWGLHQQVGMISSFSGPVSSFYSGNDKSSINGESKHRPRSRLSTSAEIEEEFDGYGGDGRFRGQRNGYIMDSREEIEDRRYGLDLGRCREAEEVPKSGSLNWPRSSFGSSIGEVEELIENRPRRSLSELLELDARPMANHVDDELPTSSSRFHCSPTRRSLMGDTLNHRRAGGSDDNGVGEYEDYVNSGHSSRNEMSRDPNANDFMYGKSTSEDKFESLLRETRDIGKEIEEKEFSKTALSDIEEEKVEGEGEKEDEDDRRTEQTVREIVDSRGLEIGCNQAEARDSAEHKKNPWKQKKEAKIVESVRPSIKSRITKFMNRFSFLKHSGKERSDSQKSGAQGPGSGSQFEEVGSVPQRKSKLLGGLLQPKSKRTAELGSGFSGDTKLSGAEDLPNTERPTEGRKSYAGSSNQTYDSPGIRARTSFSGHEGAGEFPNFSHEFLNGECNGISSTLNNACGNCEAETGSTGELSFDEGEFHDAQDHHGMNGFSQDLSSGRTISRDVEIDDYMFDDAQDHRGLNGFSEDLSSGRTISRDVEINDDMLISPRRRFARAEDIASIDLEGSDDELYYRDQYYSDSYHDSSSSRSFAEDISLSATPQEGLTDDEFVAEGYGDYRESGIVCKGLDLADSLGLSRTNDRLRYLINWLVNSLLKLHHPSANSRGNLLVRIYGPKVKYDRGAAVAFNLFDYKGALIQPSLVQAVAGRSNISLGVGRLCNIVDPDLSPAFLAEKERWFESEKSDKEGSQSCVGRRSDGGRSSSGGKWDSLSFPVVTAALSLVTNFQDVYKLWALLAKFLDADFVSKEKQLQRQGSGEVQLWYFPS
ncbi:hypothetical protein R1flu_003430 [Riccia fluitans]|uniref:Molybdenum cofactor sulfurase n=1 Tax=Riccia fluitans TaxID=41844 RepID=A0ABD1Y9J8_9MARC